MTTFRNFSFLMILLLSMSVIFAAALAVHAEVINLEVLNPIASMKVERVVLVPRPLYLNDKRIPLYWNRKLHPDVAVDQVKKELDIRLKSHTLTTQVRISYQPTTLLPPWASGLAFS